MEPELDKLFRMALKHEADFYLEEGSTPLFKMQDKDRELEMPPLTAAALDRLIMPCLNPLRMSQLERTEAVSFTHIVDRSPFSVWVTSTAGVLKLYARRQ